MLISSGRWCAACCCHVWQSLSGLRVGSVVFNMRHLVLVSRVCMHVVSEALWPELRWHMLVSCVMCCRCGFIDICIRRGVCLVVLLVIVRAISSSQFCRAMCCREVMYLEFVRGSAGAAGPRAQPRQYAWSEAVLGRCGSLSLCRHDLLRGHPYFPCFLVVFWFFRVCACVCVCACLCVCVCARGSVLVCVCV